MAFSIALGLLVGIFPIFGSTTFLCFLAGFAFKLNHPLLQTINYLMYPVHLALIIPFIRLGEFFFGAEPIPLSIPVLKEQFSQDPMQFLKEFGLAGLHGIAGWCLITPILFIILYRIFLSLIEKVTLNNNASTH